mgnify:FL=1|tara:strand:+ start:23472 stop:24026 length:555 start_codon:yes stop_codon:yes gene_type:complete
MMKRFGISVFLLLGVTVSALGFVYSGLYPIGADSRHNALTFWLLETLRTRSIQRASANIQVPSLDNPKMLLQGGADYDQMCAACHLKPGQTKSDLSIGLYPAPPNLTLSSEEHGGSDLNNHDHNNHAERFWVIKHGIMASGMPAWGPGHDDDRIWAMVAFINRLPELSEGQYQILTAAKKSASH